MADNESKQDYIIDASEAFSVLDKLEQDFLKYNQNLGTVISQQQKLNFSSGQVIASFTQITEAGKKIVSTVQSAGDSFKLLTANVTKATDAERAFAAEIRKGITDTQRLADSIRNLSKAREQLSISGKPLKQIPFIPSPEAIPLGPPGGTPIIGAKTPGIGQFPTAFPEGPAAGFSKGLASVPFAAFNAFAKQVTALDNGFKSAALNAQRLASATSSVQNALGTIGKIAGFSLLYHSIYAAVEAMESGIHVSAEFYRQIGLIQTLADENANSFGEWSNAIKNVANEFGKPGVEVAQAAYEGLSNQVLNSVKDIDLLRKATEFSRITNSTATQSLDLFSSAINSFDLNAQDASRLAKTFFQTIDVGRVKVSELANSFGKVGPAAKLTGISLEEVNASISILTNVGIKGNDALTLMNNVINTLAKPGDELSRVLKENGHNSGQAAVQALGYVGVLALLRDKIHGNTEELAKLFPNLRGFRGAATLAGEGFDALTKFLDKGTLSTEKYDKKVELVNKNIGQRFQDSLQKVKNFFELEVGEKFLKTVVDIADRFGGLVNIAKVFVSVLTTGAVVGAAYFATQKVISFTKFILTAIDAVKNLTAALGLTNAALAAFGKIGVTAPGLMLTGVLALAAGIAYLASRTYTSASVVEESFKNAYESIRKESDAATARLNDNVSLQQDTFSKNLKVQEQSFFKYISNIQKSINSLVKSELEVGKRIGDALKDNFEIVSSTLKKNLSDLEEKEHKAEDTIQSIQRRRTENLRAGERAVFEHQLDTLRDQFKNTGYGASDIGNLVVQRSRQLQEQGKKLYSAGDITEGSRFFDESRRVIEELNQGRKVYYNTEQLIRDIQKEEDALLAAQIPIQKQIQEGARQAAQAERARIKTLQDLFAQAEGFKAIDKEGKLLPEFETPEDAKAKLKDIQNSIIGILGEVRVLNNPDLFQDFAEQTTKLSKVLEAQFGLTQFEGDMIKAQSATDNTRQSIEAFGTKGREAIDLVSNEIKSLNGQIGELQKNTRATFKAFLETGTENLGTSRGISNQILGAFGGENVDTKKFSGLTSSLFESLQNIKPDTAKKTIGQVDQLKAELEKLSKTRSFEGLGGLIGGRDEEGNAKTMLETLDNLKSKIQQIDNLYSKQSQRQQQLKEAINATADSVTKVSQALTGVTPNFDALKTEAASLAESKPPIDDVAKAIANIGTQAQSTLSSIKAVKEQLSTIGSGGGGSEQKMQGGPVYRAVGGSLDFFSGKFAKGSDNIPVMASPGEFFVRNPYSQEFRPVLDAINSGKGNQIFNQQRSSTQVGNIHVHVQGGDTSAQSITAIGQGLQRALRTGLLKLH